MVGQAFWTRISLKTKALLVMGIVMTGTAAMAVGWTRSVVAEGLTGKARQELTVATRMAAHILRQRLPEAEIMVSSGRIERIRLAQMPGLRTQELTDEIARVTGTQIALHVLAAGGDSSAIGATARLPQERPGVVAALPSTAARALRAGEPFRGDAQEALVEMVPILSGQTVIGALELSLGQERDAAWLRRLVTHVGLAMAGAMLAGLLLLALAVARGLGPIHDAAALIRRLAAGETGTVRPDLERRDEFGELARALAGLRDHMVVCNRARMEADERVAAESARAAVIQAAARDLAESAAHATDGLIALSGGMMQVAGRLGEGTGTATERMTRSGQAMGSATENVRTAAAAAAEMSSVIAEISRQVGHGGAVSAQTVEALQATRGLFDRLDAAGQRIGDVLKLITAIAGQTNMLALNATIEAARAGVAGRGFAIVAQEVKQLAGETARATDEIRAQIDTVRGATAEAVTSLGHLGACVTQIDGLTLALAGAIEQQSAATEEIARSIAASAALSASATGGLDGLGRVLEENGHCAGTLEQDARDLLESATRLRERIAAGVAQLDAA